MSSTSTIVWIEQMIFDGAIRPLNGNLRSDLSRPGIGLELKRADAGKFKIFSYNVR